MHKLSPLLILALMWGVPNAHAVEAFPYSTAEEAAQELLNWSQRVKSFDGSFQYATPRETFTFRYKADFQGNRWAQTSTADGITLTRAVWNGRYSERVDRPHRNATEKGEVILDDAAAWNHPRHAEMLPDDMLAYIGNQVTFEQALSRGRVFLGTRSFDGEMYLGWDKPRGDNSTTSFNCYFWPNGDVSVIEKCARFGHGDAARQSLSETLQLPVDDLYEVYERTEFLNYVEIDGTRFPQLIIEKRLENPNLDAANALDTETPENFAAYVKLLVEGSRHASERIREFRLDIANTRLNTSLTETDFKIEYGTGDVVTKSGSGKFVHVLPWYLVIYRNVLQAVLSLNPTLVLAGVSLCGILLALGLLVVRRYRHSSAR